MYSLLVSLSIKSINFLPFEQKLQEIEKHIHLIARNLQITFDDMDEWLITWPEYGLNSSTFGRHFLISEQKAALKELMKKITKEYPKLKIVPGTVSTTHRVDVSDKPEAFKRVEKIGTAYRKNGPLLAEHKHFKEAYQVYTERVLFSQQNYNYFRNTAYWFFQGECIQSHSKSIPYRNEAMELPYVFKPGALNNVFNKRWGIEICAEHGTGILAQTFRSCPIQLILSATISIEPIYCVSPYVVQVDSQKDTIFITEVPLKDQELLVYSYDLEKPYCLQRVYSQTMQAYILKFGTEAIIKCKRNFRIENFLFDLNGRFILNPEIHVEYCMDLLMTAAKTYDKNYALMVDKAYKNESTQQELTNNRFLYPTLALLLQEVGPHQHLLIQEQKELIKALHTTAIEKGDDALIKRIGVNFPFVLEPSCKELNVTFGT